MDTDLKAKWVSALRSGKYKQGTQYLYNDNENSFCCLGVLCVVKDIPLQQIKFRCTTDVREWIEDGPEITDCSFLGNCLNDKQGKTFDQIANFIEKNL
jgi:hypothetical protein